MNEVTLKKHFVKKKSLLLTFFVLYSLFFLESVFADKQWNRKYVQVKWVSQINSILTTIIVYDYSFGRNSEHGYLKSLCVEACFNDRKFFTLMDITTPRQDMSQKTTLYLKNKLENAQIKILDTSVMPPVLRTWPDDSRSEFQVKITNNNTLAGVTVGWNVGIEYRDISYLRVSGKWQVDAPYKPQKISYSVYRVHEPVKSMLKSNASGTNTNAYKNDTVKVFNESEAIVIKGADLGANIKVYNISGVEIKSVTSNNDIVKIILPAKQYYIVHVGKSRFKVGL